MFVDPSSEGASCVTVLCCPVVVAASMLLCESQWGLSAWTEWSTVLLHALSAYSTVLAVPATVCVPITQGPAVSKPRKPSTNNNVNPYPSPVYTPPSPMYSNSTSLCTPHAKHPPWLTQSRYWQRMSLQLRGIHCLHMPHPACGK